MMNPVHPLRNPHVPPSPLKVLFGCGHDYEKSIVIQADDTEGPKVSVNKKLPQPHVFVTTAKHVGKLFEKNTAANYVVDLVKQVLGKNKTFVDAQKNIFADASPDTKRPKAEKHVPIAEAAERGLEKLPADTKEARVVLPKTKSPDQLAADLAEKITLRSYNPYHRRQNKTHPLSLEQVTLMNASSPGAAKAIQTGVAIGKGMNLARYLVDAPAHDKTPTWLGEQAKKLASPTLSVNVHDKKWIEDQKMGLFLSVAQGNNARQTPKLVEMVYTPKDGQYDKTILMVGKGIVFDTGGTNLKNAADQKTGKLYIHGMHGDMAGAAAVIGAMKALDETQPERVRVIGLAPFTPNLIGQDATLPHDIYYARNGKAVEISNTDAEGRLILADALHYGGEKYNPDLILDIATLTGGKVAAVGAQNAVALMGNDDKLVKQVSQLEQSLGRVAQAGELTEGHRRWVTKDGKGKADVYNSVGMKAAEKYNLFGEGVAFEREKHIFHHSLQGGAFLKEFLHNPKTPWVHFDMAGAEFEERADMGGEDYATGFGVKDLYNVVRHVADGKLKLG